MTIWPDPERLLIARYLASLGLRSPNSRTYYKQALNSFQDVAERYAELGKDALLAWLQASSAVWAVTTRLHRTRIVDRFLDYLLETGAIERNPVVVLRDACNIKQCMPVWRALASRDPDGALAELHQPRPFGGVLGFLCVAPFVIPGVVLAIGFYAAYAPPPLALYGTALILILAFTTRFLPIGYVNASAALRSLNPEMEEAVRVLGGSRLTALRRVVAPLLKRSLLGAWLLIFIPATRELSAAIFLYGPNTKVASVMIFDMSEEGNFERLAALALILQVLTLPLLWVGQKALGRDFMLRRNAT